MNKYFLAEKKIHTALNSDEQLISYLKIRNLIKNEISNGYATGFINYEDYVSDEGEVDTAKAQADFKEKMKELLLEEVSMFLS